MALICISALLGWHLSVIIQRLNHTVTLSFVSFRGLTPLSRPVPSSLLLNTGVFSVCTETSLILHHSTEVTTEKNPQYCKRYGYILFN